MASRQLQLQRLVAGLGGSEPPTLPVERLRTFCGEVARLMAAGRVDLWLHDRQTARIERIATSDQAAHGDAAWVLTSDSEHEIARTLRQPHGRLVGEAPPGGGSGATVAVPLRGRRRALGVLLIDGLAVQPESVQETLDSAEGLAHQLATIIESTQLLDDVLRTRRELEDAFDSMRDQVFVCGQDGHVSHVNEAVLRRFGRRREELLGQPIATMLGPRVAEWLTAGLSATQEQRRARTTETKDAGSGETFLITATPLADTGSTLRRCVVVARDVSEERRLGAEQAALREQLARSEAMGQLIAGIAHELNNPLQSVLGHLELLPRAHRIAPSVARELRIVYRESDRAARIVRNLLVLAGSGHVVKRPVSVNAALRRAIALRASACRRSKIAVVRRLSEAVPRVSGDAVLLQQAFLNLIINAEQAIVKPTGRIEIRSSYSARTKRIVVEVRDSGPGIAADVLPRVFDPFFTTKNEGTGLGLAMTRRIIHEHGGDVEASPRRGRGATFTVKLPVFTLRKR